MSEFYYYGHGKAYLSDVAAGVPTGGYTEHVEVSSLSINVETDRIEHMSKSSRVASRDLSKVYMVNMSGTITLDRHNADTLAQALYGANNAVAGGSFSATDFEDTAIADGEIHRLPGNKSHLSALTIKDSAGSPVTLTLDTHYEIVGDLDSGLVKFLDVSGFTQPFTAEGTEDAGTAVGFLTNTSQIKALRFYGINVAEDGANVVVDLYRCDFSPANLIQMLGEGNEVNKYEIPFMALKDPNVAEDATFGQFGRYRLGQT